MADEQLEDYGLTPLRLNVLRSIKAAEHAQARKKAPLKERSKAQLIADLKRMSQKNRQEYFDSINRNLYPASTRDDNVAHIRTVVIAPAAVKNFQVEQNYGMTPYGNLYHTLLDLAELYMKRAVKAGFPADSGIQMEFEFPTKGGSTITHHERFRRGLQSIDDLKEERDEDYFDSHHMQESEQPQEGGGAIATLSIVAGPTGGCNAGKKDKIDKKDGYRFVSPKATTNNNCFFTSLKALGLMELTETGAGLANKRNYIRAVFKIAANQPIPFCLTIAIFEKFRTDKGEFKLFVRCEETQEILSSTGSDDKVNHRTIKLENSHYEAFISIDKEKAKCKACWKTYVVNPDKPHKCCTSTLSFVNNTKNGRTKKDLSIPERAIKTAMKKDKKNNTGTVIHYDLETYPVEKNGFRIHVPYVVGYNHFDSFQYFAGRNCMEKFVDYLLAIEAKVTVNAYNGAKFDHYFVRKELIRRKMHPTEFNVNNGAIIKFTFANVTMFDLLKHLPPMSFKANLKDFGCAIQKGDFDHTKGKDWEDMDRDTRNDCIKYLYGDVMGLRELYGKVNQAVWDKYEVNVSSFLSTSSLAYNVWRKDTTPGDICLPTLEQEDAFRLSVYGGRCYKTRHVYESTQRKKILEGSISFDELDDYCIDADVVSLYPTAMCFYDYPIGEAKRVFAAGISSLKSEQVTIDKLFAENKLGIYFCTYVANKNCQNSAVPRRDCTCGKPEKCEKKGSCGNIKWDLKTHSGWYTSVDIEHMWKLKYEVHIQHGWYWEQKKRVFADYITEQFQQKAKATKGTAPYNLAKLFMNSLYGKMIQRPIYNKTKEITTNSQFWKFYAKSTVESVTPIDDNDGNALCYKLEGYSRDPTDTEKCITKPTQLGAFVLAYSRRIMLEYMMEANPDFSSENQEARIASDFYYTDTDSLQMHCSAAKRITRLGDKKLGGITGDVICEDCGKSTCKIIRGIWIAPKLYALEYVCECSPIEPRFHFRGKGLNTDALDITTYEKMLQGESLTNVREFSMKKIHTSRNSNQQLIPQFSIVHRSNSHESEVSSLTRVVNTKKWDGRLFQPDGSSVPHV